MTFMLVLHSDYTKYQDKFMHFHALRVMKGNEKQRCKKHKNDFPDMEVIKRIECEPNAVVQWKRIKEHLVQCSDPVLRTYHGGFNIVHKEWSIDDVITELVAISNEKLYVVVSKK